MDLSNPDTWPHWPTLRLRKWVDDDLPEGVMVAIEAYRRTVFLIDIYRFQEALYDAEYPLSNLPQKEYPTVQAIIEDGWTPTF